jgi:Zn-dependent protease with chaperone function
MPRVIQTNLPTFGVSVGPVIVLGRYAKLLEDFERQAIIVHEHGHIEGRHALKRLARLLSLRWDGLMEVCRRQELEADKFAVRSGHALGLISFLSKVRPPHKNALHPTPKERISHIMSLLGEELHHG